MGTARKTEASRIDESTLELLNGLLPDASPVGAYAMGMLCAAVWQEYPERPIPLGLLEAARGCTTVEQAGRVMETVMKFAD